MGYEFLITSPIVDKAYCLIPTSESYKATFNASMKSCVSIFDDSNFATAII